MSAQWPSAVVTTSQLYVAVNELQNNLSAGINSAVTTIALNSATGFPTVGLVLIDNEVIQYTNVSGNSLTGCTRAFDGTSAAAHSSGATVSFAFCAAHYNNAANEVIAVESYLDTVLGKGTTVTAAEFARLSGVTSAIQTQLNAKAPTASPTFTGTITTPLTANRAVATGAAGVLAASATTATELGYVSGVTSAIQTQIDGKSTGNNQPQNILINGGFDFWQRNTTFTSPATSTFTADQWKSDLGGSPTFTISKETTNTHNGASSLKLNVTVVNSATTCRLFQSIENYTEYRGQAVTLSAWIKTSAANVKIAIYDGSTFTESSAHTGSGNWELLTLTVTLSAAAGDFAVFVGFLQTTVNTGAVYIDDMMLVLGSTAVTYTPKNYEAEFAQCQRYYFKTFNVGVVPAQNIGSNIGALSYTVHTAGVFNDSTELTYPVQMRAVPTITTYSPSAATANWYNASGSTASGAPTVLANSSARSVGVRNAQAAADAAQHVVFLHLTADAGY